MSLPRRATAIRVTVAHAGDLLSDYLQRARFNVPESVITDARQMRSIKCEDWSGGNMLGADSKARGPWTSAKLTMET
eukprot:8851862-Pyramimonas_sp.AAC.1